MKERPKRRYEATITAGGDTWKDLIDTLKSAVFDLEERGRTNKWMVTGGPSNHSNVEVEHDPHQTHDRYHEQLRAYLGKSEPVKRRGWAGA